MEKQNIFSRELVIMTDIKDFDYLFVGSLPIRDTLKRWGQVDDYFWQPEKGVSLYGNNMPVEELKFFLKAVEREPTIGQKTTFDFLIEKILEIYRRVNPLDLYYDLLSVPFIDFLDELSLFNDQLNIRDLTFLTLKALKNLFFQKNRSDNMVYIYLYGQMIRAVDEERKKRKIYFENIFESHIETIKTFAQRRDEIGTIARMIIESGSLELSELLTMMSPFGWRGEGPDRIGPIIITPNLVKNFGFIH